MWHPDSADQALRLHLAFHGQAGDRPAGNGTGIGLESRKGDRVELDDAEGVVAERLSDRKGLKLSDRAGALRFQGR